MGRYERPTVWIAAKANRKTGVEYSQVLEPYAKAGYVSHQQHRHISLLKFVETIFDLKPLIECKEQVDDILDCFEVSQKPLAPIALRERRCT
jgi:hypothetical protein